MEIHGVTPFQKQISFSLLFPKVHGVEYAFGAHDYPTSGVFEVVPRQCPGFKFKKSVFIGTTTLDPVQVRDFMEHYSERYNGDTYHLIVKNCNHFCDDICQKLTGKRIPKWVNRLARIGSMCNCVLPEGLRTSVVKHDPNYKPQDSEKKRLRSSFSLLSSVSRQQKSSLLSHPLETSYYHHRNRKDKSMFYFERKRKEN
ncbi:deSI-like protein At4g17486 isoform X2 [Hibiscus syriacus]|uniref:deSI-like protein At4g17486 isoform X2 n=1 Tax=Hibiscus syriacus TaxID=106335 RepID=UPI001923B52A|nr:deSI-like protein At4g17486 isoform X2 [Hibiscus syriacus]